MLHHPNDFFYYHCFHESKLVFFLQHCPEESVGAKYLLETAPVNSWLCFRHNISRSDAPVLN